MEPDDRNILGEADKIINDDRPDKYGKVEDSYQRVADLVNSIHTSHADEGVTPELALKVMIATKLVRDHFSPGNPDHLRDAAGYIGLLDQYRQRTWRGGPQQQQQQEMFWPASSRDLDTSDAIAAARRLSEAIHQMERDSSALPWPVLNRLDDLDAALATLGD